MMIGKGIYENNKHTTGEIVNIDQIKKDAVMTGLKNTIDGRVFDLTGRTFEGFVTTSGYCKLGECIKKSRRLLDEMEELLKEVNKIDGKSK